MNLHTRGQIGQTEGFQLAPMIDIVFVVLVFFVATYAVMQEERLLGLQLPEATTGKAAVRQRQQILLNLDSKGEIYIEQRHFEPAVLQKRLGILARLSKDANLEPSVIIRADGACPHRKVIRVMDICSAEGISDIQFSTLPVE